MDTSSNGPTDGVVVSSDTVTPTIAQEEAAPITVGAESPDISQEIIDKIFSDVTAYPNGREMQASFDRRIAELQRENAALRSQAQAAKPKDLSVAEAIQVFGDDRDGLIEFLTAKTQASEEAARAAQLRTEEAALRQQEVKQTIDQANVMLANAGLDWSHPLVVAFKKKYPAPTASSLNNLAAGIIKYQRETMSRVQGSIPKVVADANAKALQSSGVTRVASGTAEPVNIQTQLRRAVLAGNREEYLRLKALSNEQGN